MEEIELRKKLQEIIDGYEDIRIVVLQELDELEKKLDQGFDKIFRRLDEFEHKIASA